MTGTTAPIPPRDLRVERLVSLGLLLAAAGLGVLLVLYDPSKPGFPLPMGCGLRRLTGIACPGCGGTRATYQLLHGDLLAALDLNPLLVLLAPVLIYAGLAWLLAVWTPWRLPTRRLSGRQTWVLVVAVLAFTVLRNLPWWPMTVLAP